MFAVGHRNRTRTRILIRGRPLEDRQEDAATREGPVAPPVTRCETPVAVAAPNTVH